MIEQSKTRIVSFKLDSKEYEEIEAQLQEGESIGLKAKEIFRERYGYLTLVNHSKPDTLTKENLERLIEESIKIHLAKLSQSMTNDLNYSIELNQEKLYKEIDSLKAKIETIISKPEITNSKPEITLAIEQSKLEVDPSKPEIEQTKSRRGRKSNAEKQAEKERLEGIK